MLCDKCKTDADVETVFFPLDRSLDAAGSMDTTGRNLDLCPYCRLSLYRKVLHDEGLFEDFDFNKKLVKAFDQLTKKGK
jgi:hypothetical protein